MIGRNINSSLRSLRLKRRDQEEKAFTCKRDSEVMFLCISLASYVYRSRLKSYRIHRPTIQVPAAHFDKVQHGLLKIRVNFMFSKCICIVYCRILQTENMI